MSGFAVAAYWEGQANAKRFDTFTEACECFNRYAGPFEQGRYNYLAFNQNAIIAVVTRVDDLMRRLAGLEASNKSEHYRLIERFSVDFAGGFNDEAASTSLA